MTVPYTSPIISIFGFTTALGSLPNLIDATDSTFWAPYADGLDGYTMPPLGDAGFIITGYPRAAIQFDFGDRVRVPMFQAKVEGPKSLGEAYLLASDSPATSVDDTVQAGDTYAGHFTLAQMNSNAALATLAQTQAIRARFWRFIFIKQPPLS